METCCTHGLGVAVPVQAGGRVAEAFSCLDLEQQSSQASTPPSVQPELRLPDEIFEHRSVSEQSIQVFQLRCKDDDLPTCIRVDFIKKVYVILICMILCSFAIALPAMFCGNKTLRWFQQHPWVLHAFTAVLALQYCLNLMMIAEACFGGTCVLNVFLGIMVRAPWNYLYLMTFSVCMGVIVAFWSAYFSVCSVIVVFGMSICMLMALTAWACQREADFSSIGSYFIVIALGLFMTVFVSLAFGSVNMWQTIIAGIGATAFGVVIIFETQMIFGSACQWTGLKAGGVEYTVDMYALAAWHLYLDFINIILILLQLLGARRE